MNMIFRGKLGQTSWSDHHRSTSGRQRGFAETSGRVAWAKTKGSWQTGKLKTARNTAGAPVRLGKSLMGGIATGIQNKSGSNKSGATIFVVLSFLLFLFDVIVDYRGFYITDVDIFGLLKAIMSFGYLVGVWAVFFLLVGKDKSPTAVLWNVIVLIFLMITTGLVFQFNPIAMFHMIFILILWFFYLRDQSDVVRSNKILLAFLFADLYLFSILNALSPGVAEWFVGFPFLFLATNYYVWQKSDNRLAEFFIFAAFAWYFLMGGPAIATNLQLAGFEGLRDDLPSLGEFWKVGKKKLIVDPAQQAAEAARAWITGRIQYAITGKVEENQYEPLGVYLEGVQSAEPRFYEDEDIIIWGSVKARTLDDPVNIKLGCYVKDDDKKLFARDNGEVDPKPKFSVFALEDQDFVCRFDGCDIKNDKDCDDAVLKKGPNTVTAYAEFNFQTLSYLKVYFIDKERRRAMIREGIDIFDEFDITDRNPTPIYTNGPAEIGMETTDPLISVSDDYLVFPRFSLSLQNRKGWEGTITELKELVLFFPEGVTLDIPAKYNDDDADHPCNKKFQEYDIETCKQKSCNELVYGECKEVCEGFLQYEKWEEERVDCIGGCGSDGECISSCDGLYTDKLGKGIAAYDKCIPPCDKNLEKCESNCDDLFAGDTPEYTGYTLDLSDENERSEYKDFEDFKMFNCRITPDPDMVLENTPITTKFFRAQARYDYIVEDLVTVKVEELPKALIDPDAEPEEGTYPTSKVELIYDAMQSAIDSSADRCVVEYDELKLGDRELKIAQRSEQVAFAQIKDNRIGWSEYIIRGKVCLVHPQNLDQNVKNPDETLTTPEYVELEEVTIIDSGGKYQIITGGEFDANPNAYFNLKDKPYLYKVDDEHVCFIPLREDGGFLGLGGGDCDGAKDEGIDDDCFKGWINNNDIPKCEACEFDLCSDLNQKQCNTCTNAKATGCEWAEYSGSGSDNDECVNPNREPALIVKIDVDDENTEVWDFRLTSNRNIDVGDNVFTATDFPGDKCLVFAVEEGSEKDGAIIWDAEPGSLIEKRNVGRLLDGFRDVPVWHCEVPSTTGGYYNVLPCDELFLSTSITGLPTIGSQWYTEKPNNQCGNRCPLLGENKIIITYTY